MKSSASPIAASRSSRTKTWAASRLRLGQANVGFWVLVSVGVLWMQPALSPTTTGGHVAWWCALVLCYVLVQFPFDVAGGYSIPVAYGRREPGFSKWMVQWLRGAAVHAGVLAGVGASLIGVSQAAGLAAAAGLMAAVALVLVAAQGPLGRLAASLPRVSPSIAVQTALSASELDEERVSVLCAQDSSFVGGWVGLPGLEKLVLPRRWSETAGPDGVVVSIERRAIGLRSGARTQGLVTALGFNALGVGLVLATFPGAGLGSATGLLTFSAGVTVWAFLGLVTLPTWSRRAVYALDRQVADRLADTSSVARVISRLDRDQEDELDRSAVVGAIFHPVPAPAQRALELRYPPDRPARFVPWRVARMALFTSWASLSLLSRAVHCNIGRPDLWVMFPGD